MTSAPFSSDAAVKAPIADATPFSRARDVEDVAAALAHEAQDGAEDETARAFVAQVRRFGRDEIDPARIDADAAIPARVLDGARRLGLFGLTIPARHGGAELSMKACAHVIAALAELDGSVATTIGLHAGLGLRALVAFGAPEVQARWLPLAASGERIAAFAATEPGAGSDLAAIRTVAEAPAPGGDHFVLRGEKCFVTNGGLGGFVTVLAHTPGQGGRHTHGLFVVDLASPGVEPGRPHHKLGLRGSSTVDLHFDGVRVPADQRLGPAGAGMDQAHTALAWGRTFLSAGCIGTARAALALAREHTARRRQFGRALESFELVGDSLAQAAARLHAMESVVRLVTELEARAPGSVGWESAVAKVLASEDGWWIVDRALQLHGGVGYMEHVGVARRLRDIRVTRIFEGANDVLRVRIAQAALTWPRNARTTPPLASPAVRAEALGAMAASYDATLTELFAFLRALEARHGLRLCERQLVLSDLADAFIGLYAAQAVLLRADGELAARCDPGPEAVLSRARAAIAVSLEAAEAALWRLRRRDDTPTTGARAAPGT